MPVIPLAISGARNILPANTLLPRPGRILVSVLPQIVAPDSLTSNAAANYLRDQSRAAILRALNEPDLDDDGVAALAAQRSKS
jgi:1-acyl-sn-glycerol-3-phosphate acyltransferase